MGKSKHSKGVSGNPAKRANASKELAPRTDGPLVKRSVEVAPNAQRSEGDIRVFLSYARTDDSSFDIVTPFKELLSKLVHVKTGRRIIAFLDQEDIQWGNDWRDQLTEAILGASVFIPLLSTTYLESRSCRDEFNSFYSAAKSLGVTELMLPVLLFRAPEIFNEQSTDDIVLTAVSRQYEVIEDAILSDRGSSQWLRTMNRLADRFASAYNAAERQLEDLAHSRELAPRRLDTSNDGDANLEEDELGITELMVAFEEDIGEMTLAAEELRPAIEELGGAAKSAGSLPPNSKPRDALTWSLRVAEALKQPSLDVRTAGGRLLAKTKSLDGTVIRLKAIASEIPILEEPLTTALGKLSGLEEVSEQMAELLESLRPAELLSTALRKALRPLRSGLTDVNDAIAIIQSWTKGRSG